MFREGSSACICANPRVTSTSFVSYWTLSLSNIIHGLYCTNILNSQPGYRLAGIHLNSRNNTLPEGFAGSISRSCHSLQEVQDNKQLDYVFLSPIFQSISKEGYGNGFPMERLREAAASGIINEKVIALGGIEEKNIPLITSLHFGGAAILGALWGKDPSVTNETSIIKRYKQLDIWQ